MASRNQPPWGQPTSSLVSLEADLARAGLGLSEAGSTRASWLLSWHGTERKKKMGWQGMGKETPAERRVLAQALAIHPNSRFTLLHS